MKQPGETKPSLGKRAHAKADAVLADKLKISKHGRLMTWHYLGMLWEQLRAMLPITLLQVSQAYVTLGMTTAGWPVLNQHMHA